MSSTPISHLGKDSPGSDTSALSDPRTNIVVALHRLTAHLSERARKPFDFHFVSQAQAHSFTVSVYKWDLDGRSGPYPQAPAAEVRAAMYDQAASARKLAAFARVSNTASLEFSSLAANGFEAGLLITPLSLLRCLIERIAHASSLADAAKSLTKAPSEVSMKKVLELSETVTRALYATSRDWPSLATIDFRTTDVKKVSYVAKQNIVDLKPTSILTAVDRLDRRVSGSRLTYEVLCEFLHPNIGDLMGSTTDALSAHDRYGTRHLMRRIGTGPKSLSGTPDQKIIIGKILDVSCDIIETFPLVLQEIDAASQLATRHTQDFAHKVIKKYRHLFGNQDPCPCLSGLDVKRCKQSKKMKSLI